MALICKSKVFNFWLRYHLCAANNPYPVNVYAFKGGLQ